MKMRLATVRPPGMEHAVAACGRGGKTFSALRLGTGMAKRRNGRLFVIDTEAGRACKYAREFSFEHVPFEPPYKPSDFLAAIQSCVAAGAGAIVVDSMSDEHEGIPGGVLDWHQKEMDRLATDDQGKRERFNIVRFQECRPCAFLARIYADATVRQVRNAVGHEIRNFLYARSCKRASMRENAFGSCDRGIVIGAVGRDQGVHRGLCLSDRHPIAANLRGVGAEFDNLRTHVADSTILHKQLVDGRLQDIKARQARQPRGICHAA